MRSRRTARHPGSRCISAAVSVGTDRPQESGIAHRAGTAHDPLVRSELTAERVRSDIAVLSRGGLDVPRFLAEVDESLQRAVPYDGACYALIDPATRLLTKTFKFGDLNGCDDHDVEWAHIEYGAEEATSFLELADRPTPSAGVHVATGGDVAASRRMRDYMVPYFGYADELRAIARSGGHVWGGIALFRAGDREPFSQAEVDFLGSLSDPVATGIRAGVLARCGAIAVADHVAGPAVIVVDASNEISQMSPGAEQQLDALADGAATPLSMLAGLVARARRWATGDAPMPPRLRVRVASGDWLVLHAAPLAGRDGRSGDVVVTIELARPPEIVPLVVAAFDLSAREREVAQLVLQGVETKQIAARLHMSPYTVQDHLKSIFDKADVRSRRELIARVFFDHYAARLGDEISPTGWFASG